MGASSCEEEAYRALEREESDKDLGEVVEIRVCSDMERDKDADRELF